MIDFIPLDKLSISDEDKLRLIHNADPRYLSDKERKLLRGEK